MVIYYVRDSVFLNITVNNTYNNHKRNFVVLKRDSSCHVHIFLLNYTWISSSTAISKRDISVIKWEAILIFMLLLSLTQFFFIHRK
jgi:hypothetical protein